MSHIFQNSSLTQVFSTTEVLTFMTSLRSLKSILFYQTKIYSRCNNIKSILFSILIVNKKLSLNFEKSKISKYFTCIFPPFSFDSISKNAQSCLVFQTLFNVYTYSQTTKLPGKKKTISEKHTLSF